MNGIVLIDKPATWTSFDVVNYIRRIIATELGKKPKNVKVGHTGTLDPFATGLMVVVVGTACKEAERFSKLDKEYTATLRLGAVSTTDDPEGDIEPVHDKRPSLEEINAVIPKYIGEIEQIPPQYSAIKINGQRAYKLARAGQVFDMPSRKVTVYSMAVVTYEYPFLTIKTHVSSGTYIRTLARNIGEDLGVGAYLQELRRTKIANYTVDKSVVVENFMTTQIIPL